jgi:hypothetical protein
LEGARILAQVVPEPGQMGCLLPTECLSKTTGYLSGAMQVIQQAVLLNIAFGINLQMRYCSTVIQAGVSFKLREMAPEIPLSQPGGVASPLKYLWGATIYKDSTKKAFSEVSAGR